ncbi:hypothetical protein [Bacillus sp. ISL-7]|uniref:hypothetical protein n=1 Tax=Bacillus sp. ISL-7 TaxID=2819136 RepID=UPI001BE51EAB|nr:hypothetical protein [Bacillus sp. ISL-7]MBT2734734.1 hypothetical protein [Bacillus sp. ISL-7]
MSNDKKVTSIESYRTLKFHGLPLKAELAELLDKPYSQTENNIFQLIKEGNEVVSFYVENKSIILTFFDGKEAMNIRFYIDENGDIETALTPLPFD